MAVSEPGGDEPKGLAIEIAGWNVRAGRCSRTDLPASALPAATAALRGQLAIHPDPTARPSVTRSITPAAPVPQRYRPVAEAAAQPVRRTGRTRGGARDPFDPEVGKWAVVVLKDDAALAERALEPLLRRRVEQGFVDPEQGSSKGTPGLVVIDRPASENPDRWLEYVGRAVIDVPATLLFLGGPDRFPFEVQARFDRERCTGRLDVGDTPGGPLSWEACRRYAEKVVAFETGELPVEPRALLYSFGADDPTRQSRDGLISPLREALATSKVIRRRVDVAPPEALTEEEATIANLVRKLQSSRPALVFTASHGLEHPPEPEIGLWGALTDVRYRGGPADPVLSAGAIPQGAFAPGAVMFCFACFSAGVPEKSAMAFLTGDVDPAMPGRPFVPALPRALLAKEDGPIAFVGHVDRATSLSFAWTKKDGPAAFEDFCEWSLGGYGTLGQAMRTLRESAAAASQDLASALSPVPGRGPAEPAQRILKHWIRWHDMKNYLLLGDPAIRVRDGLPSAP